MKNIFLIIICLYAYQVQAQYKQCVTVAKVGSNIEISIKETSGSQFMIGTSDVYFNTGGLSYTLTGTQSTTSFPLVLTNIAMATILSPYTIEVFQINPGNLVISIVNNNGGTKMISSTASDMIASIPVTGSGTPYLTKANIFNTSSNLIEPLCNSSVLPLELLSFGAEKSGEKSLLQWESVKEKDMEYYAVERSIDGKTFKTIGYEKPKARTLDEKVAYNFVDEKPEIGINYYRLQMKDFDGTVKYSKVASVDFGSKIKAKTYPNPFSSDLTIEIDIEKNIKGDVFIDVLDMTGKVVQAKKLVAEGRRINFNLPTDELTSGTYLIRMKNGNDIWQQKITKQ